MILVLANVEKTGIEFICLTHSELRLLSLNLGQELKV